MSVTADATFASKVVTVPDAISSMAYFSASKMSVRQRHTYSIPFSSLEKTDIARFNIIKASVIPIIRVETPPKLDNIEVELEATLTTKLEGMSIVMILAQEQTK